MRESLANSSLFAQLNVEPNGGLSDKSLVSAELLDPSDSVDSKEADRSVRFFELGARLESDAKLSILAGQSLAEWPQLQCRPCSARKQSGTPSDPFELRESFRTEWACEDESSFARLHWIRPAVIVGQAGCALVTLLLVVLLLRLRRSRVSQMGQPTERDASSSNGLTHLSFPIGTLEKLNADYHRLWLADARDHAAGRILTLLERK